jgi:hypothetical protein
MALFEASYALPEATTEAAVAMMKAVMMIAAKGQGENPLPTTEDATVQVKAASTEVATAQREEAATAQAKVLIAMNYNVADNRGMVAREDVCIFNTVKTYKEKRDKIDLTSPDPFSSPARPHTGIQNFYIRDAVEVYVAYTAYRRGLNAPNSGTHKPRELLRDGVCKSIRSRLSKLKTPVLACLPAKNAHPSRNTLPAYY